MHGMYAGKERRNRMVALVLALVLVAGVVLALVATVVQAGAARAATTPIAAQVSPRSCPRIRRSSPSYPPTAPSWRPARPRSSSPSASRSPWVHAAAAAARRDPVETGEPQVDGRVVTAAVTGERGPGAYRFVWQVTGSDGHRLSGESSFTVTAGAAGSTPRVTPTYKTPQTQPTTFGHPDHLPGLIVAGILLLAGVALLVYEHRRRAQSNDGPGSPAGPPGPATDFMRASLLV